MKIGYKKYRNNPTEVDGIKFQSGKEAKRWLELKLLNRVGHIYDLERQVTFELTPSRRRTDGILERKCSYIADFVYTENGKQVVEDAKGARPPDYILKRKMMLFIHNIEILET